MTATACSSRRTQSTSGRQRSRALRDDDLSRRLGDAAYSTWLDRFSPQVALSNLEALYREARELHVSR